MVDKPTWNHGKYFLTLVFASIFLFSVGIFSHNAFADIVISDQTSCVSQGGVWDSVTNTCTLHSSAIGSFINYSETLSCSGITLDSGGFLVEFSGTLIVKPDCTFNDHGFTVSNGTIVNEGVFNNFGGVEVTNIFNNTGIFNNNSTFQNYNSGFPTVLTNSGTINNYHSIGNQDIINNLGIINNEIGAGITDNDLISNKMGGTIVNNGTIYISPYFVDGTDHPLFYGTLDNYGSINNNADGMIDNEGNLNNECGGTIVNNGTISGNQTVNISCQQNTVTTVSLNPDTVSTGERTSVTANVTNTNSTNIPTGSISFDDNNAGGSFGILSCNTSGDGIACDVNYTAPSTNQSVTITATYSGDATHAVSSGIATLRVNPPEPTKPPASFIATIPVGNFPYGVAVNPITNMVYVTNQGSNSVSVIDGKTNSVVSTIPIGSIPYDLAVNPITNKIYAANWLSNTVSVIDGNTNAVLHTINVPAALGVAVNPITNKIYVTSEAISTNVNRGMVSEINGTTDMVESTIMVGENTHEVALNTNTNMIYVANSYSNTISVIDGRTNTIVSSIPFTNPFGMAINNNTNIIYLDNPNTKVVSLIDSLNNNLIDTIPVEFQTSGLAVDPHTDVAYVVHPFDNAISVISGKTNQVVDTIPVGSYSLGIAINQVTNTVYVANANSNTVSVLHGFSPPEPPTALTVIPKMPPQIILSWTSPSDNGSTPLLGYMIERSTDNGATWSTIVQNTNSTGTTYTDSHLIPVKVYTYRVSAINSVGTSEPSTTVSIKPLSVHHT